MPCPLLARSFLQPYSVSEMAQPGVKVALSTQGEAELCNDPLGPSTVRNKPGYITHVVSLNRIASYHPGLSTD